MRRNVVDFSRLRILVVENHVLMRRLLHEMLVGFSVPEIRTARDVMEAIECVYEEPFDAVILDYVLVGLNGPDFAQTVRYDEECPNREVPILMITGTPDHHKVAKVKEAGINGMLAKPITPRTLYNRLYAMLAYPRPFIISADYVGPMRDRRSHKVVAEAPSRTRLARGAGAASRRPAARSRSGAIIDEDQILM